MKNKVRISIYLIREGAEYGGDSAKTVLKCDDKCLMLKKYNGYDFPGNGELYYAKEEIRMVSGVNAFFKDLGDEILETSSFLKAVYFANVKIDEKMRRFAVCLGGADVFIDHEAVEPWFGFRIMLNGYVSGCIKMRRRKIISWGEDSDSDVSSEDLGINISGIGLCLDTKKPLSGIADEEMFGKTSVNGSDAFRMHANVKMDNLDVLLTLCYKMYEDDKFEERFGHADEIRKVCDRKIRGELEESLLRDINEEDAAHIWTAIPGDINDNRVKGITLCVDDSHVYQDLDIGNIVSAVMQAEGENDLKNVSLLKKSEVRILFEGKENPAQVLSVYDCIYFETEYTCGGDDKSVYFLYGGKWYYVGNKFVENVNQRYSDIRLCNDKFPNCYKDECEWHYNKRLNNSLAGSILMDKICVSTDGNKEMIEPCDVMWDRSLIFTKKRRSSSDSIINLSSQINDAVNEWTEIDYLRELKKKVELKYGGSVSNCVPNEILPSDYRVIAGIIFEGMVENRELPEIPFRGRSALCNAVNTVENLGYKFEIKPISTVESPYDKKIFKI